MVCGAKFRDAGTDWYKYKFHNEERLSGKNITWSFTLPLSVDPVMTVV